MKYKPERNTIYLMREIKHGYNLLFLPNGLSASLLHNLVAGVLGVGVGITALYMSWRGLSMHHFSVTSISGQRDSSEIGTVAGLHNLGNNCFLNVILQALSSSSYFLPYLQDVLVTDDPVIDESTEVMPLTISLTTLLEELCIIRDKRTVFNPRRIMLAMGLYINNFNLTRQQDAAEAFLHLLSSLEEEFSRCYMPHSGSLADITHCPSKIYELKSEGENECKRWQNHFFGPFNGTIGSKLTCTSCSSVLSMDFEFFRCLPLSPMLDVNADFMNGLSVVDCLEHFSAIEVVENYRCSQCWHNAALKYLSLKTEKDEVRVEAVGRCVTPDTCSCRNLFLQEEITWTGLSSALKQLKIARTPRILCLHLQRAFVNPQGESIKFQEHISFPLHLDIFPFMEGGTTLGQRAPDKHMQRELMRQQQRMFPRQILTNMQMLSHMHRIMGESLLEDVLRTKKGTTVSESTGRPAFVLGDYKEDLIQENKMVHGDLYQSQTGCLSETDTGKKVSNTNSSGSKKSCMYHLSSVVEHYGRPGSGHYAVYRRAKTDSSVGNSEGRTGTTSYQWFYASDCEVSSVTEETVLAAEASLLFYEKIETCV